MHSRKHLLNLGAFLGLVAVAAAQTTVQTETITYTPGIGTVAADSQNPAAAPASSATASTSYGAASATASLGHMQLTATSSLVVGGVVADDTSTNTFARARWNDNILVTATAPELAGTNGKLHARFTIAGSASVPASVESTFAGATPGTAGWTFSASPASGFGDENSIGGGLQLYIDFNPLPPFEKFPVLSGDLNFQTFDLYIPFTFGDDFGVQFQGSTSAVVAPRGMAEGTGLTTASNITITWLGIVEVVDLGGMPISGVSIQSTGGWMTAAAIPEPSTYAALAGVAALGLAGWRRHREAFSRAAGGILS